jgi:hypothetical protein
MKHALNKQEILTIKNAFDIDCHYIVPSLGFGEVIVRSTPCNPRVVYKDVKLRFTPLDFGDESIASSLVLTARFVYQISAM